MADTINLLACICGEINARHCPVHSEAGRRLIVATPEQFPVLFSFRLWRLEVILDRNIHVGGITFKWHEQAAGPGSEGERGD